MSSCVCSIDSAEDYDNSFYHSKTVKARKYHLCVECQGEIMPGENYEYVSGLSGDGDFFTQKTCSLCAEIRNCFFCSWEFGRMWEQLTEVDDFKICEIESLSDNAQELFLVMMEYWDDED